VSTERERELEAKVAELERKLKASARLADSLCSWGRELEKRLLERSNELDERKEKRSNAGRPPKTDGLSDRTFRDRKRKDLERTIAKAREAWLAPVVTVRRDLLDFAADALRQLAQNKRDDEDAR
jgi:hypothetical protein